MHKKTAILAFLIYFVCLFAAADEKVQPKPAVISAQTVAFITFSTGDEAKKLKDQTIAFFLKWKRYQVLDDPSRADLIVLIGPMPRHVNSDALDAVLAGKPSPVQVDTTGAQSHFAVFDGSEVHGQYTGGTLKPVWSTEMSGDDVKTAAKKYKQLVDNAQESYDHMGLTFDKCRAVGLRCSH
jgi:hypothetical protein